MQVPDSLRISQDRETPVQVDSNSTFAWRYAYARAAETRASGETGQDYLTFASNEEAFLFALCDGVSQSFYGDVAARAAGDALLEWLEGELPASLSAEVVGQSLSGFLNGLTVSTTALLQEQAIPDNLPPMLLEVLEQKRAIGSETTFVCGRVDMPSGTFAQGRVVLAWMGDSRMRFWGRAGERTIDLGDTFKTEERWSSSRGLVGNEAHIFTAPLQESGGWTVQRLLVYSDGLAALDDVEQSPTSSELESIISRAQESPTSDDISLLEVWLTKAA